jgi:hypothetical protein
MRALLPLLAAAGVVGLGPTSVGAQEFDPVPVALAYHKLSNDPLDFERIAASSDAVRRASNFDRPDAQKAEVARLQALLAAAQTAGEFTIQVNDNISEYDHDKSEFSIALFTPGSYVPLQAFGQQYQLVFANAERARVIAMAKEPAREFDLRLNGFGRRITDDIRFKVVGKGDPSGGVTGERVIRAELVSVRVLDPQGQVLYTPDLSAAAAAAVDAAKSKAEAAFDIASADVAGFRVGVKGKAFEATLARLFGGKPGRMDAGKASFPGITTVITLNQLGCDDRIDKGKPPHGSVCVVAFVDGDDVVRMILVSRTFGWMQGEVFRDAMVKRYGPVADARSGGSSYTLGWGPETDYRLAYDRMGIKRALTASWTQVQDFMGRSGNALADIRIDLQLTDAKWASEHAK